MWQMWDVVWVANHLYDLDWHELRWQVEARWQWIRRVKVMVAVVGIDPRVSCGIIVDRGAVWWLWTVVAMVAAAEHSPWISHA